jgi:tryptophan synthase alpha chain
LLLALEDAGADCIEVGIPFSDPLADGPVIQAASARALAGGAAPLRVLDAVASVRRRLQVPLVVLSYWNPIVQFGADGEGVRKFIQAAKERGLSGVIVPDLPVEEGGPLRKVAAQEHFAAVCLAAPTSPAERLRRIARASQGFIYYVSVTGTTGTRGSLPPTLLEGVRRVKRLTSKPVCVGFGISTPEQAHRVASVADGVIVGSAVIQTIAQARGRTKMLQHLMTFLRRLRKAV